MFIYLRVKTKRYQESAAVYPDPNLWDLVYTSSPVTNNMWPYFTNELKFEEDFLFFLINKNMNKKQKKYNLVN